MPFEVPFLTAGAPALDAVIRRTEADFRVEEVPLYEPDGEGDHVFFCVEKQGTTTPSLVRQVASRLGVRSSAIGFAGLKDAHAVTRQVLSVEHVAPEAVLALRLDRAEVLWARRHGNKLRRGHLAGNRFRIVLRDCDSARAPELREVLRELERTGLPNAFGPQRFGARGDGAEIGRALVEGDHEAAVRRMAGLVSESDYGPVRCAREAFDAGDHAKAASLWPRGFELGAKLSSAMARHRGRTSRAVRCLTKRERAFFVSAWQSELFNRLLAARMPDIDRLLDGDVAWNHGSRRFFEVRDLEAERARASRFEVSPAGPLAGPSMRPALGSAGALEQRVLGEAGVALDQLEPRRFAGVEGGRRPLRVQPTEVEVRVLAERALELEFRLPAGSYATALLHELCRGGAVDESLAPRQGLPARPVVD